MANDDGGKELVSLINGTSDKIHFKANNMFTVDSPNFSINGEGDASFSGTLSSPKGKIGNWKISTNGLETEGDQTYITTKTHTSPVSQATLFNGKLIIGDISDGPVPETENGYIDIGRYGIFCKSTNYGNEPYLFSVSIADDEIYANCPVMLNGKTWINGELYAQHANMHTSTNAPSLTFGDSSIVLRSTSSSKRYKHDITTELSEELNPKNLYGIKVVQYKFNDDYLDEKDSRKGKDVIGLIADDVADTYPIAADFIKNEKGENQVEDWNYRYMIPAMLKLIQEQKKEIDLLKESVSFLMEKNGEKI